MDPNTPLDAPDLEQLDLLRRNAEAAERCASYLHTIRTILLTFFIAAAVVVGLWAAGLTVYFFGG